MKKFTLLVATVLIGLASFAQVDRNMVLVEIMTGTWCYYCPGAALGADELVANGHRVAIVESHTGDSYANTYSNARNSYYNPSGVPTAYFDGTISVVGGNHTTSMYPTYKTKYNQAIAVQSPLTFDYTMTQDGLQFTFDVTATKVGTMTNEQPKLYLFVTQSEITQAWQGQTHLNFVNRKMVPDQNGTALDFTSGDVQNVTLTVNVDPAWPLEDLEFVLMVQDVASKKVYNSARPVQSDFDIAGGVTEVCKGTPVSFESTSIGRPAEYLYLFPGGTPASSTEPNPVVIYNTAGVYDVTLITKTGLVYDTIIKQGYLTVKPGAELTMPEGPYEVCTEHHNAVTTYSTSGDNITDYTWDIYPADAGVITNNGSSCSVAWSNTFDASEIASIRVKGVNDCGEGEWTPYVDITGVDCTGAFIPEKPKAFEVYPNPASNYINVVMNPATSETVKLTIVNALGKVVYSENILLNGTTYKNINTNTLSKGLYFVHAEGKQFKAVQKIAIDR